MRLLPRFARYSGVSVMATVLAQAGLALGYGLLRWPVVPSVALSLAVSVGPAYLLCRRYVWPDAGRAGRVSGEAARFFALALVGAGATVLGVWLALWLAVHLAGTPSSDRAVLALVANAASVSVTGTVWVARFIVLDRALFARAAPAAAPVLGAGGPVR